MGTLNYETPLPPDGQSWQKQISVWEAGDGRLPPESCVKRQLTESLIKASSEAVVLDFWLCQTDNAEWEEAKNSMPPAMF